jgi:hypothetical protein
MSPRYSVPPQTGAKVAVLLALTGFAIALALYPVLRNGTEADKATVIEDPASSDR